MLNCTAPARLRRPTHCGRSASATLVSSVLDFDDAIHHRRLAGADIGGSSWSVRCFNHDGGPPQTVKRGAFAIPRSDREVVLDTGIRADQGNADFLAWRHTNARVGL